MTRLLCPPRPCPTCPYRRDTPPGIWDATEYEKLREWDENPGPLNVFHCHQQNATGVQTVCKGWLVVHGFDAIGARIAVSSGWLTVEDVEAGTDVPLYGSGQEAAEAGLAGISNLTPEARVAMAKLVRRGAGRQDR